MLWLVARKVGSRQRAIGSLPKLIETTRVGLLITWPDLYWTPHWQVYVGQDTFKPYLSRALWTLVINLEEKTGSKINNLPKVNDTSHLAFLSFPIRGDQSLPLGDLYKRVRAPRLAPTTQVWKGGGGEVFLPILLVINEWSSHWE